LPITMGYDRYPEHLIDEKAELFSDFEKTGEHLFFTHDPEIAAARLRQQAGRYQPDHELGAFRGWDLDSERSPATVAPST